MSSSSLPAQPDPHRLSMAACSAVGLLALAVRLLYCWQASAAPMWQILMGDAEAYDTWGRRLAAGDWLGSEVFYQAPLYPYFLGAVYTLLGHDIWLVRLVQVVLGSLACVCLAQAGAAFIDRRAGWVAGVLLAIYPSALFFDTIIQKSGFDLLGMCVLLMLAGRMLRRPGWALCLGLGAVLGLLTLTRENALVLAPVLLGWIGWQFRDHQLTQRVRWNLLLLAGMALVLLPVAARNYAVGGEFHLTTSQLGTNLYIGNNEHADGGYRELRANRGDAAFEREDATELAEAAVGRPLTPAEVSHYWTSRTIHYITTQPGHWLKLMGRKWLLVWNAVEMGDTEDQYAYALWSPLLRWLTPVLHMGVVTPLAVLGVVVLWPRRRKLALLYAIALVYALGTAAFFVFARYRFPLVPIVLLLGAGALTWNWRAWWRSSGRKSWQIATGLFAVTAAAVACNWPLIEKEPGAATTLANVGIRLVAQGKYEQAAQQYRKAIAVAAGYSALHTGLAEALVGLGKLGEARQQLALAIQVQPGDWVAHEQLGQLALQQNRTAEAAGHFMTALQFNPRYTPAHQEMARLSARAGLIPQAIAHYEQVLQEEPESIDALNGLGVALARDNQLQRAAAQFEKVLQLAPGASDVRFNLAMAYRQLHQPERALDQFEQLIRLKPGDAAARTQLGWIHIEQKRWAAAAQQWGAAIAIEPDRSLMLELAWLLATCPDASVRDPAAALQLVEQVAPLPASATDDFSAVRLAQVHAAALAAMGQFEQAAAKVRTALQTTQDAAPSDTSTSQLQKQLQAYERADLWLPTP